MFGFQTLRCQACGTTDIPVDPHLFMDRLHYFVCFNCFNQLAYDRYRLDISVELWRVSDHTDHYRHGGNLISKGEAEEHSDRQYILTAELMAWMRARLTHDPFVRMGSKEVLDKVPTKGRH